VAKANHFLTHLALLVGPEALSRPVTAQVIRWGGVVPRAMEPEKRAGVASVATQGCFGHEHESLMVRASSDNVSTAWVM
jgi:hypothetical protein